MNSSFIVSICLAVVCFTWAGFGNSYILPGACGEPLVSSLAPEITAEYPIEAYLIGIGEAAKTDDAQRDKTLTEILARLEIAKQIKVRVREESFELRCEGGKEECRNKFSLLIEETVDVFLEGSRVVRHGEQEGRIFAVAILPRSQVAEGLKQAIGESIKKIRESLPKAAEGDRVALKKAQEEYLRALVLEHTKGVILQDIKSRSSEVFEELEKEISGMKLK